MSNKLTEWRWNRDWGMVKLAPHSPVAASEGFYKVTDVRDALREVKELEEANEQLRKWRVDLIADIARLEDQLRRRPEPFIHVFSIKEGFYKLERIVRIDRSDDLDIYIHGD